jgi:hypothetical protein
MELWFANASVCSIIEFDTDEWFRPFIMEWLNRTDEKWSEWAEREVEQDKVCCTKVNDTYGH